MAAPEQDMQIWDGTLAYLSGEITLSVLPIFNSTIERFNHNIEVCQVDMRLREKEILH